MPQRQIDLMIEKWQKPLTEEDKTQSNRSFPIRNEIIISTKEYPTKADIDEIFNKFDLKQTILHSLYLWNSIDQGKNPKENG